MKRKKVLQLSAAMALVGGMLALILTAGTWRVIKDARFRWISRYDFEGVVASVIGCLMLTCCVEKRGPVFIATFSLLFQTFVANPLPRKRAGVSACDHVAVPCTMRKSCGPPDMH